MKIYTKTGDKGKTSLYGGKRVLKSSVRVEAYGTIDELESMVGFAITLLKRKRVFKEVMEDMIAIQLAVMEIGVLLANPNKKPSYKKKEEKYFLNAIASLEKRIDEMTEKLPVLTNFIVLGGGITGGYIFVIRAVARRAERKIVALLVKEYVPEYVLKYCNRLSDYLFTAGRYINMTQKEK